ncbi:MAG: type III-A CRISPR-associated RAMP protein Csm5 [Melioribacter sp.]|nr:type III-A CRISPR-associated RAMP protein Csm5 [Melioribacter sp.]
MNKEKYLSQEIFFKTITPIFIGGNQASDLSPYSDYVQLGNKIIYVDDKKFERALSSNDELIEKYVKAIRQKIDKSRTQSDFSLHSFIENNLGEVKNFAKTTIPVDQDIKHQSIKKFIATSGRPFIPGSSLKGALRTAIIYDWLINSMKGKTVLKEMQNKVNDLTDKISALEKKKSSGKATIEEEKTLKNIKGKQNVNKELSYFYDEQKLFGRISKDNQSGMDSRNIQVSDSDPIDFDNLSVLKLQRIKLRDNSEVSPFPSETLNNNVEGKFKIKLTRCFNQPDLQKYNSYSIMNVFQVLNQFSLASIKYELGSFNLIIRKLMDSSNERTNQFGPVLEFYKQLETEIEQNNNEYAIIRIGGGKTFFDNSIGLALFNSDIKIFKQYRELLELGKNPLSGKLVLGRFPTTRSLVEATKLPIGWIALSNNRKKIEQIDIYKSQIIPFSDDTKSSFGYISKPASSIHKYTLAEILDDKSKPAKVKILEGEFAGQVTILSSVRLINLGLTKGSKIYVDPLISAKVLQKADYKSKYE